jgi:hypothetical protein
LLRQHAAGWLHGLYRKQSLLAHLPAFLAAPPLGDDIVLLLEICLARRVVGSDQAVMYKRLLPTNNSKKIAPKTPRAIVKWQCRFGWTLIRVILRSPLATREKTAMIEACAVYLGRRYSWGGWNPWIKTWIRAGCHWSMRVDRP